MSNFFNRFYKEQLAPKGFMYQIKKVILAFQHLIAMFGATVLVPILTGLDTSVALFSAGVGTLIFHFCTKMKVPVFLGSSFAFIPVIIVAGQMHGGDLRYAQGGLVMAGLLYVIIALLVKTVGVENIKKILPAQVIGPMIMVIGLNLLPVAFADASKHYFTACITLTSALLVMFLGKGFVKQLAILLAVIVGYLTCLYLGMVDTTPIVESSFLSVPHFTFPLFSLDAIVIIAPVVLAVLMEHVGDITTNGQICGKNFIEDPGLNRTLVGDGLATAFAGFIGGPANTTYGENTGVLAITKNYSPAILRLTAVFAIALSLITKVGGFLKTIPPSVMGGISVVLFSMIAYIGFKNILREKSYNDYRKILVMVIVLFIGLGSGPVEKYVGVKMGIPITDAVSITGLSLAAVVGIVVNAAIFHIKLGKK